MPLEEAYFSSVLQHKDMKKLIRQHFRNLLALLIRSERWKRDPKNQEIVYRIELFNKMRGL